MSKTGVTTNPRVVDRHGRHLWTLESLPTTYSPDFRSKDCEAPVFTGYPNATFRRCRKCNACRSAQKRYWYVRATKEASAWPRTWFVTLTFSQLSDTSYQVVQKWLKRTRQRLNRMDSTPFGASHFSYLCVYERGKKRGRPHYHLLVHCQNKVTRRSLEDTWKDGFSKCSLARPSHTKYVVKYIGKELEHGTRIRASRQYGKYPF